MDIVCTRQFDNAIPTELCEEIIKSFDDHSELQHEGHIGYGKDGTVVDKTAKDSTEIDLMHQPKLRHFADTLLEIIHEKLDNVFVDIGNHLRCDVGLSEEDLEFVMHYTFGPSIAIYSLAVQKIKAGTEYRWHQDSVPMDVRWNILLYLNTIEEGGKTIFANGLEIQPKQGTLVFFPSTWTNFHKGEYIKGDTDKYIIAGQIFRSESSHGTKPEDDPILKFLSR